MLSYWSTKIEIECRRAIQRSPQWVKTLLNHQLDYLLGFGAAPVLVWTVLIGAMCLPVAGLHWGLGHLPFSAEIRGALASRIGQGVLSGVDLLLLLAWPSYMAYRFFRWGQRKRKEAKWETPEETQARLERLELSRTLIKGQSLSPASNKEEKRATHRPRRL